MVLQTIPPWLCAEVEEYFQPLHAHPLKPEPHLVLDIGANIGVFARRAHAEWPNARILCYEPVPSVCQLLRRNVVHAWAEVHEVAVAGTGGLRDLYLGDCFATGSLHQGPRQRDVHIQEEALASSQLPAAEVIKIDTEGAEVEIIRGLDLSQAALLMIEHHRAEDAQTIKEMLSNFQLIQDSAENSEVGVLIFMKAR